MLIMKNKRRNELLNDLSIEIGEYREQLPLKEQRIVDQVTLLIASTFDSYGVFDNGLDLPEVISTTLVIGKVNFMRIASTGDELRRERALKRASEKSEIGIKHQKRYMKGR